jgi:hypothetical protein
MTQNMGGLDRGIRAALGLALIGWGVATSSWIGALGAVPLLTAILGWCPAYLPFGWKTCKAQTEIR